jgi:hypothetical protein
MLASSEREGFEERVRERRRYRKKRWIEESVTGVSHYWQMQCTSKA